MTRKVKKSAAHRPTRSRTPQDAVALLKADHRLVAQLFRRFESASGQTKRQLAERICTELTVHTILEEELFYPACRRARVESDRLDEAQVEHDSLKVMIAGIEGQSPQQPFYDAKVKVLCEYVTHHVREEERPGGLFTQARRASIDLKALGEQLKSRKQFLTQGGARPPAPKIRSLGIAELPQGAGQIRVVRIRETERTRRAAAGSDEREPGVHPGT